MEYESESRYTLYLTNLATTTSRKLSTGVYQFDVNWDVLLPKEHKKFRVTSAFHTNRSETTDALDLPGFLVCSDLPSHSLTNLRNMRLNVIGLANYSTVASNATSDFQFDQNMRTEFCCHYPSRNTLTITFIRAIDDTTLTDPQSTGGLVTFAFHLFLTFTPIPEKNLNY
jgi:hypothetical protein